MAADTPVAGICKQYAEAREKFGAGRMPKGAAGAWLSRLVEAAEANPDDPWTPQAYMHAATLAQAQGEDAALRERLYRAWADHPLTTNTDRVRALLAASDCALRRTDTVQVFHDLNRITREIEAGTPREREANRRILEMIPMRKAQALEALRLRRLPAPELPPPDTGKSESDLWREVLEQYRRGQAQSLQLQEPHLLYALSTALEAEGRTEEAASLIREIRDHPQTSWPKSMAARIEAQKLDPEMGELYIELPEEAEATLPRDEGWRDLTLEISTWYRIHGDKETWAGRVEALWNSDDPEDRAYVRRNRETYATYLWMLGDYYLFSAEPTDPGTAVAYYERLLAECPDYPQLDDVRQHAELAWEQIAAAQNPGGGEVDDDRRANEREGADDGD